MKITKSTFDCRRAIVFTGIFGGGKIKVAGTNYDLRNRAVEIRCIREEKRKPASWVVISILATIIAIVCFGPFGLLALAMFAAGSRSSALVNVKLPNGEQIVGIANHKEWQILKQYLFAA